MSGYGQRPGGNASGIDDDLVSRLAGGLMPVRPVRLVRSVAGAIALETATVVVTAAVLGVHATGLQRLGDPWFVGLLAMLSAGMLASAAVMARVSIPGRSVGPAWRLAALAAPLVLAVAVVSLSPWGGTWNGFEAVFLEGIGCTRSTILVATPAWLAGLLFLRRLAPLDPLSTGLFSSSAALLASALVVQMACPNCDSWHLAVSHYLPLLFTAWLAALLSAPILRIRTPRG